MRRLLKCGGSGNRLAISFVVISGSWPYSVYSANKWMPMAPKDKIIKPIEAIASKKASLDMPTSRKASVGRDSERNSIYRDGKLFPAEGGEYRCVIHNISDLGAHIRLVNAGETTKLATLKIDGRTALISVEIPWRNDDEIGLVFIQ